MSTAGFHQFSDDFEQEKPRSKRRDKQGTRKRKSPREDSDFKSRPPRKGYDDDDGDFPDPDDDMDEDLDDLFDEDDDFEDSDDMDEDLDFEDRDFG